MVDNENLNFKDSNSFTTFFVLVISKSFEIQRLNYIKNVEIRRY